MAFQEILHIYSSKLDHILCEKIGSEFSRSQAKVKGHFYPLCNSFTVGWNFKKFCTNVSLNKTMCHSIKSPNFQGHRPRSKVISFCSETPVLLNGISRFLHKCSSKLDDLSCVKIGSKFSRFRSQAKVKGHLASAL